jgi:hypothetical protein
MPWRGKAAALLPHSKTWRREAIPDHHIDNSKKTITIRDEPPTQSLYLPPGRGVRERQLSPFPYSLPSVLDLPKQGE